VDVVSIRALFSAAGLVTVLSLAGCASQNGPVQIGFTGGNNCQTVRAELTRLDQQGVPGKIEAQQAGRKLSPEAAQQVSRYNSLLQEYLGNQCQLPSA
jgi:hypothetical protein